MSRILGYRLVILAGFFASSIVASPVSYTYVNWSSSTPGTTTTPGTASGSLTAGSSTIAIGYSGDLAFAQTGAGGTDYYIPTSVYTNSQVANVPTNNNLIGLDEAYKGTNTLTFSSPLLNPILDIVSLGAPGLTVSYNFDATPVILSQGAAYFGGCSTCLTVSGDSLNGTEGSGVIEFLGSYSSISWTTTNGEFWNGFTVGVQGLGTVTGVPEPGTFALLALAGAGLIGGRRMRFRSPLR